MKKYPLSLEPTILQKRPLPKSSQCPECKAHSTWEIQGNVLVETECHSCQCSRSTYKREEAACLASGGHDPETISAGQHSFDSCVKCGHSC